MTDKNSLAQSNSPEAEIDKVRQIVLKGLKDYRVHVYLFGSWASGKPKRFSDIDVGVLPLEQVPGWVFSNIREALEESNIVHSVDLVNLQDTDPGFRERVKREGVLWRD